LPYLKTDALGNTTQTDFDGNGNTTKLTDELGNVTGFAYDGLDRTEQKTFADGSYQTWIYDATGNVTSLRTAAGNNVTRSYDGRNEWVTQTYPVPGGSSMIMNGYDLMGRLLTASEGGAALTYAYDNLGRNTSFTDQAGRASSYTYDLNGNRLTANYPTGVTAKGGYDALNWMTTLKDAANNLLATNSYDSLDRVTGVALGNGTSVTPSFDLADRLTSVNNALTSVNRNYGYDNASRITSITEPRGTVGITGYDSRNEVTAITEPTGSPFASQGFAYDAGWNRSSWTNRANPTRDPGLQHDAVCPFHTSDLLRTRWNL
jgi:YD repeat-containing protein